MKECPNCKKAFTDDLFFCLYDGTPLSQHPGGGVDSSAATEVGFASGISQPTEVFPRPAPVAAPAASRSKLPYVVIALLALVCVGLAGAVLVTNLDRFLPAREDTNKTSEKSKLTTPVSVAATPGGSPAVSPATATSTPSVKQPDKVLIASGKWKGQWSTDSGSMLDFELTLSDTQNNGVDGQIKWTLRRTVRPDKMDKVGQSAIEFVRGTFDPVTGSLKMSGYSKDDPNSVLVMIDDYKLTVSQDGKTLTGVARNGGKWNGHVRLSRS
jgi:hypothetical protein